MFTNFSNYVFLSKIEFPVVKVVLGNFSFLASLSQSPFVLFTKNKVIFLPNLILL